MGRRGVGGRGRGKGTGRKGEGEKGHDEYRVFPLKKAVGDGVTFPPVRHPAHGDRRSGQSTAASLTAVLPTRLQLGTRVTAQKDTNHCVFVCVPRPDDQYHSLTTPE